MNGMISFVKKEWIEYLRTHKLLILLIVFVLFGIMSPLMAKLTPELLKSMMDEEMVNALQPNEPTALDSYAQFFKNVTQLGFIVLVLVCSSMLSNEIAKGTLIPFVTRGLHRSSILLAKLVVAIFVWTICYIACFLITWLYTMLLFPAVEVHSLFLGLAALWLFGVMLISFILIASTCFSAAYSVLVMVVAMVAVLFLLQMIGNIQAYNPLALVNYALPVIQESTDISMLYYPFASTIAITGICTGLACYLFKKTAL